VTDPKDAVYATNEFLRPQFVIPMHYGTTPVLKGTLQEYLAALGQTATKVFVLNPGDKDRLLVGSAGGCMGPGVLVGTAALGIHCPGFTPPGTHHVTRPVTVCATATQARRAGRGSQMRLLHSG
jgi:hypothetical protein